MQPQPTHEAAEFILMLARIYVTAGALFGAWFVLHGAGRLDPVARRGTLGFRLLIIPGAVALWPLLLAKSISRRPSPSEPAPAHAP